MALDRTVQRLEKGEITSIDALLSEEYATPETRRIDIAGRRELLCAARRARYGRVKMKAIGLR